MSAEARLSRARDCRKHAKACGVAAADLPSDTASREKFQELAATVAASSAGEALKAQAAAAFKAYEDTFPAEVGDDDEEGQDEQTVGGVRLDQLWMLSTSQKERASDCLGSTPPGARTKW